MEHIEHAATQVVCRQCGSVFTGPMAYCCLACETLARINHGEFNPALSTPQFENEFSKHAYLDQAEFRQVHALDQKQQQFLFFAEGLHCSSCVHLLEKLPEFDSDIVEARVHFGNSTVRVELKPHASLAKVATIIQELGYRPIILGPQSNILENQQQENRTALKRIAIAGACTGNIMLFVIPVYSGLAGTMAVAFNWLSFLLFLPILIYSAVPFYQGAMNSLKYKVINVDLPITIALLSGFVFSTFNLIRNSGEIYYDSTASFLFLILSSRYLLKRVQQHYLGPSRLRQLLPLQKVSLQLNQDGSSPKEKIVPASSLKFGDVIRIDKDQLIPADGILLSENAEIDSSLLTGESLPRRFSRGLQVYAGTKLVSQSALIRIEQTGENTRIGHILEKLEGPAVTKTQFIGLAEQTAQYLILVVFAVAILFFALYASQDINIAFNRALALIVVACPCALAFGAPLAFGMALSKAREQGILMKNGDSLERILFIKKIFFDKTGTLTTGQLRLSHNHQKISLDDKQLILALEANSYHPVAFSIREAWPDLKATPGVTQIKEIPGKGIEGLYQGQQLSLFADQSDRKDGIISVSYKRDGRLIAILEFTDELKSDSSQVLQQLKKLGYDPEILSGDQQTTVARIGQQCGLSLDKCHGEMSPEQKLLKIQSVENSCMIGDGANDSLSLKAASVGIAVKGSVDLSLSHADIYFTNGGLQSFLELLKLAQQTRYVLKRNLAFALIYNAVAGVCALIGWVNPMMAAILMPVSSAMIILSTLWGFK